MNKLTPTYFSYRWDREGDLERFATAICLSGAKAWRLDYDATLHKLEKIHFNLKEFDVIGNKQKEVPISVPGMDKWNHADVPKDRYSAMISGAQMLNELSGNTYL